MKKTILAGLSALALTAAFAAGSPKTKAKKQEPKKEQCCDKSACCDKAHKSPCCH